MGAGADHVITGDALFTVSVTLAVAELKSVASVGVNVTESVADPAPGIVPATGEYTKLPAVFAVAFSCVAVSAVPNVIAAGLTHVITEAAWVTVSTPFTNANE